MGSQEKPGLCDGPGKGQWLAFPHRQLGKKGDRAPQEERSFKWYRQQSLSDLRQELTLPTAIN